MKDSDQCCGVFGRLFGHKFQARTTEAASPSCSLKFDKLEGPSILKDLRRMSIRDKYLFDVCERCGKIINRVPQQ